MTDFGIAKFASKNNLNETSGTPGYMAPEVMRGLNHTGSVDYFAVGVITYELMMGKRPYSGKTRKEIKEQMMIKQIFLDETCIPAGWSPYAADFINRLLRKDSGRMGYYNDLEVKRHPWLSNINFNDLINYKIYAPFIPRRNHDNYDKKYCQEIEEIGIDTNMRYEEYRSNEKYPQVFEGFTFYNVDESQLNCYHEIYKKPNIKYMKNNINTINKYTNNNSNNNNYSSNYMLRKSKTINIDYDYKNKINQTPSSIRQNKNLSPIKNSSQNNNQNLSSYRNRSNISNRTINYSNADNSTNRKTPRTNLKYSKSNSLININTNSRFTLKNGEDIYIMASPTHRGRITINSNDDNIDNSFRKYANHSFVETNYSKGKILRRSYSSSNLHNSNYINIFNLLVNNVNNINNNNSIFNDNNNTLNINYNRSFSKLSTPISYNKINKSRIPYDRRPNSNYKNYNNYNVNENNYHCHHRSFIERPKNYSFYFIDNNENNPLFNYNYNYNNSNNYGNYKSYNNYNNENNNTFKYRNKDLNSIFNESVGENKSYTYRKDKYKDVKNNSNYGYFVKDKIPTGCIKKIVPLNLKVKNIENKSNTINVDYYTNSYRKNNSINYNKIQTIDFINEGNIPNNYLYIDKYESKHEKIKPNNYLYIDKYESKHEKKYEIKSFIQENKIINLDKPKNEYKIYEYKMNKNNSMHNIKSYNDKNLSLNLEKNINKRNSQNIKSNNSNSNININTMNNLSNNSNNNSKKNNCIININKSNNTNNKNNEKTKKDKNISYKKIPIPLPHNKTLKRKKKIEINENIGSNSTVSIAKINIINNNIINNNVISNIIPFNYNKDKFAYSNPNTIKENTKISSSPDFFASKDKNNNKYNILNQYKSKDEANINNNNNNTINNNTINTNINNQIKLPIKENNKNNVFNHYKIRDEINNNSININNDNNKFDNEIKNPFNNKQININNFNNGNNILYKTNNDLISRKINEKTFCQIKYLENFDKYKKIKNINDRNKNRYINNENYNKINNNNITRKKKSEKYCNFEQRENKIKKIIQQKNENNKYYKDSKEILINRNNKVKKYK